MEWNLSVRWKGKKNRRTPKPKLIPSDLERVKVTTKNGGIQFGRHFRNSRLTFASTILEGMVEFHNAIGEADRDRFQTDTVEPFTVLTPTRGIYFDNTKYRHKNFMGKSRRTVFDR